MSARPMDVDALIRQSGGAPVDQSKMTPDQATEAGLHGDEFLQTLPVGIRARVKAYAEGRQAFPAGISMSKPAMLQMMGLVSQYDPSFDQVDYNARNTTRMAFTKGSKGDQVNNLNTAIEHIEHLAMLGDELHNRSLPAWNAIANKVSEWTGKSAVPNFRANRGLVAEELTKAYRGSGGAEADIKRAIEDYGENMSPDQLHGVVGTVSSLLQSKADELQRQYETGMGAAAKGYKVLPQTHQQILTSLKERAASGATGITVVDPQGGRHVFPDQKAADAFKNAAGIP